MPNMTPAGRGRRDGVGVVRYSAAMQRRAFLTGLGWAAAGLALGACGPQSKRSDASGTTAASPPLLDGVSVDVHRDPG